MKNVILFFFTGVLAVIFGFFCPKDWLIDLYTKSVFYFHSVTFILFTFCVLKIFFPKIESGSDKSLIILKIKSFLEYHGVALLLSVLLMVLGIFACKPEFRIFSDETNLVSDSQVLYEKRECYTVYSSLNNGIGSRRLINIGIDKRPAFFPYFISLIHSVFGYRPENVFILNFIIGVLSLFLIYYLIQLYKGRFWGICGLCCLIAHPIFLLYTNSAGFDVFNMFCSLVLFLFIYKFIKTPNVNFAELLWLWLPIIGQSRYESIVSVFIVFPLIIYLLPKTEYSKLTFKTWISPLLYLPVVWLFRITQDPSFWQVDKVNEGFGFDWLLKNISQAFVFFLSGEEAYGVIPVISVLGLIGFVVFMLDVFKKESNVSFGELNKSSTKIFSGILVSFYLFHAIGKFSYCWTDLTNEIISRQSLIFLPLIVFMSMSFLSELNKKTGIRKSYCILAAIFLVFIYWPDAANICGVRNIELYNRNKEIRRFLEANFPNKKEYICITEITGYFVVLGYSTISYFSDLPNSHNIEPERYREIKKEKNLQLLVDFYKKKVCSYYILIQHLDKETNEPRYHLPDNFKEEVLLEKQYYEGKILRFSKLTLTD